MNRRSLLAAVTALSFACGPQLDPSEEGSAPKADSRTDAITLPPGVPISPSPYPPPPIFYVCDVHLTRTADQTVTMGHATQSHWATSPTANYPPAATPDVCERYVVDVLVPYNSTGNAGTQPTIALSYGDFGFQNPDNSIDPNFPYPNAYPSASHCTSYHSHLELYKQTGSTGSLVHVKTYNLAGYVDSGSGHCNVRDTSAGVYGSEVAWLQPPASGTDRYRLILDGQVDSNQTEVGVHLVHE